MELYGHERTCPGLVNSKNEDSEVQKKKAIKPAWEL